MLRFIVQKEPVNAPLLAPFTNLSELLAHK